jgi:hypothetical protein
MGHPPAVTINDSCYLLVCGFDIKDKVAPWQYGNNYAGSVIHDSKDAFSWKGLVHGGAGGFDLQGYTSAEYDSSYVAHCYDRNNAYAWAIYKPA